MQLLKSPPPPKAPDKPAMADLARQLGLSVATVSRALSNHAGISAATRQRVQQLADQWHFQPNQLAVSLRRGQSRLLGVIVPNLEKNFFPTIIHGIEQAAGKAGYGVLLCQSHDAWQQEQRAVDTLLQAQVVGILVSLARTTQQPTHFQRVREQGIPVVFFDRKPQYEAVNAIVLDDCLGAYQATCHLLAQGCRRVAHLAGPQTIPIYRQRYQGYCDALRAHQLAVDSELVVYADLVAGDGTRAAHQLLALAHRPDGIFSASDSALVEVLQLLKAQGLGVPGEVALVGFSNETFTQTTEPPLSTVDQRGPAMGEAAVRLCLQAAQAGAFVPQQVVLQPRLLVRASSLRHPPAGPPPTAR